MIPAHLRQRGRADIDTAAEMFGFLSGEAMLKSWEMRPRKELIQVRDGCQDAGNAMATR